MDTRLTDWKTIRMCVRSCCNYYGSMICTYIVLCAFLGSWINLKGQIIILLVLIGSVICYKFKNYNVVCTLDGYINGIKSTESKGFINIKVMDMIGELNSYVENAEDLIKKEENTSINIIDNVINNIDKPVHNIVEMSKMINEDNEVYDSIENEGYKVKKVLEDLIEVSKLSAGVSIINKEMLDINFLLYQIYMDNEEDMANNGLEFIINISDDEYLISLDGKNISRALDILLANVVKHAKSGTRVYLEGKETEDGYYISIKNTSREALNITYNEILNKKINKSTGLEIEIVKSIVEMLYGKFKITINGDLFEVDITLDRKVNSHEYN